MSIIYSYEFFGESWVLNPGHLVLESNMPTIALCLSPPWALNSLNRFWSSFLKKAIIIISVDQGSQTPALKITSSFCCLYFCFTSINFDWNQIEKKIEKPQVLSFFAIEKFFDGEWRATAATCDRNGSTDRRRRQTTSSSSSTSTPATTLICRCPTTTSSVPDCRPEPSTAGKTFQWKMQLTIFRGLKSSSFTQTLHRVSTIPNGSRTKSIFPTAFRSSKKWIFWMVTLFTQLEATFRGSLAAQAP